MCRKVMIECHLSVIVISFSFDSMFGQRIEISRQQRLRIATANSNGCSFCHTPQNSWKWFDRCDDVVAFSTRLLIKSIKWNWSSLACAQVYVLLMFLYLFALTCIWSAKNNRLQFNFLCTLRTLSRPLKFSRKIIRNDDNDEDYEPQSYILWFWIAEIIFNSFLAFYPCDEEQKQQQCPANRRPAIIYGNNNF